jgi:hypothetical protein
VKCDFLLGQKILKSSFLKKKWQGKYPVPRNRNKCGVKNITKWRMP